MDLGAFFRCPDTGCDKKSTGKQGRVLGSWYVASLYLDNFYSLSFLHRWLLSMEWRNLQIERALFAKKNTKSTSWTICFYGYAAQLLIDYDASRMRTCRLHKEHEWIPWICRTLTIRLKLIYLWAITYSYIRLSMATWNIKCFED